MSIVLGQRSFICLAAGRLVFGLICLRPAVFSFLDQREELIQLTIEIHLLFFEDGLELGQRITLEDVMAVR